MAHQRQNIRQQVVAMLGGQTDAGSRVFDSRHLPLHRLELPAIAVYTASESVTAESRHSAPRELDRRMQLVVEAATHLDGDQATGAELDNLALQIEKALNADWTWGGTVSDSLLTDTEIDVLESGDKPIGLLRLVYEARYYTYVPETADATLNSFTSVDSKLPVNGINPLNEAEDKFTLPGG